MKANLFSVPVVLVVLLVVVHGKLYFVEKFDDDKGWTRSEQRDDYGKFELSSGAFYGDKAINQGYKTSQDARFYASSKPTGVKITNEGKELVVSVSVKHEQGLDCGGGYVKFVPEADAKTFNGDTRYSLMFGPDKCGSTNRVHVIFPYNGVNLLWKKQLPFPDDKLTHVYTLHVKPNNTYDVYIDQELKESGKLEDDWAFLEPKVIDDPSETKPSDWVDDSFIDDPADTKPSDWDAEPETIVDADAKKPEDWDDEEDGAWEAPEIPNPKYKGEWKPKRIPNPAYKGAWKAKQIPNPKYVANDKLYVVQPIESVGIDVWQVKSGSIFDNIIIGDDLREVNEIIEQTWGATKAAEKAALEKLEAKTTGAAESAAEEDGGAGEEL